MNAPLASVQACYRALEALACGLAQDANLRVVLTESSWSWDIQTRTLSVAGQDLAIMPLQAAAGVVAHEVGHAALSLASGPPQLPELSEAVWHHVVNVLEDTRVERWAMERWPAARGWLDAAWAHDRREDGLSLADIPFGQPLQRFLFACLQEWRAGWQANPALEPDLQRDLLHTRAARHHLTEQLPPADANGVLQPAAVQHAFDAMLCLLVEQLGEVIGRRHRIEREALAVQLQRDLAEQQHAVALLEHAHALGVGRGVVQDHEALAALCQNARAQIRRLVRRPAEAVAGLSAEALALADRLTALQQPRLRTVVAGAKPGGGTRAAARRAPPPPAPHTPTQVGQRAQLLTGLRRRLAEAFPAATPSGWRPGYSSGPRLVMREAIAAEADPRRWRGAFARRSAARGPDAAVLLLVDLSGSMARDKKIEAAVLATSACTEALLELGVDTAVYGFQDRIIPIVPFGTSWSAGVQRSIAAMEAEVHGSRPGGNNQPGANDDGPCLRSAAALLRAQPVEQRVLLVLSDGSPSEPNEAAGATRLHDAVRMLRTDRTLTLVGLGIGHGTSHVCDFYPDARGDVAVADFPRVLSQTLLARLRSATRAKR